MDFINYFQKRFPFLIKNDFDSFLSISNICIFKKGEKIIDFGEKKKKMAIIIKGIVRGYIINYQGRELTTFLFKENAVFAAYEPLILNHPSNHAFVCLEPTEIYLFEFQDLEIIAKDNPRIKKVIDTIILDSLVFAIKRNEYFIKLNPEKRYLSFVEEHSGLIQRVSQKHIASYLGITPVSYSRLKKRIYLQHE